MCDEQHYVTFTLNCYELHSTQLTLSTNQFNKVNTYDQHRPVFCYTAQSVALQLLLEDLLK